MRELDFIGIGVSRSGTTWTWNQLKTHPQVCTPEKKEAKIFLNKIPNLSKYNKCEKRLFIGEYTPAYFRNTAMAKKIKKYSSNAKLLLMLRNPIERIFTQYKVVQWKKYGRIRQTFQRWFSIDSVKTRYVLSNKYIKTLPCWCDTFGKNLKINFYDELVENPLNYIQEVFGHIGIDNNFIPPNWREREVKPYNLHYEENPISINKKDKSFLKNYYWASIKGLQNYLKKDLSFWID
jgi:hypothetical protein